MLAYLRMGKLLTLRAQARIRCVLPPSKARRLPVRFIVGCGRSGTTILGKVLSTNPNTMYLREPYHLWHVIDPRTDVTGLHSDPQDARFFMGKEDITDQAKRRFDLLISRSGKKGPHCCVIEKTPHNAGKIGWIEAIEPEAKIVHIVRNGLSVVRSIDRLATKPTYRLAFKPNYNQWWGEDDAKWKALSSEGAARGYFSDELGRIRTNAQRASYEWVVSLSEVDRYRDHLGERLLEITYTQLTKDPAATCRLIAQHFDLQAPEEWLKTAQSMIGEEKTYREDRLELPTQMAKKMNEFQERYGFDGRATPI